MAVRARTAQCRNSSTLSRVLDTNTATRRIFESPSLLGASGEDSTEAAVGDDGGNKKMEKKIASRKQRVVIGYSIASAGYAFFTLAALAKYKFSYGAIFIAAGTLLPAGFAYILKGAAASDRLSSDTYKRLTLALGAYALVGLAAKDIITTFHAGWVITCLVALVNSVKGFGYGLKGWELKKTPIVSEFVSGARSTLSSMTRIPQNLQAAGYQTSALAFTAWKLATLWKLGYTCLLNYADGIPLADPANLSLALAFRFKKLLLLQVMSFTLKDAADRDRLNGTTFIQLNLLNSVTSAALAAYYYRSSFIGGISLALNSIFCGFNGFFPSSTKTENVAN